MTMFSLTCRVGMVVGPLGDGIHKLGAVRDHAAVIGQTVLAGVVSHGVVGGGLLGPDQGRQHQQHEGRHGLDTDTIDIRVTTNLSCASRPNFITESE